MLIAWTILAMSLSVIPSGVMATTTVSISATPALKQVDPGSTTVFTLEVQNTGTAADVVSLEAAGIPRNWTAIFADENIEAGAGKTVSTTLTVRPTKDAIAGDTAINITATASIGGSSSSVILKVRIKQIFQLDLQIAQIGAVTAGETASIPISLRNDGNGQDNITLSIIPNGSATAWAQSGTKTFDLGPGQSTVYTHIIPVAKDVSEDRYQFIVRARSSGTGVEETKNVDVGVQKGAVASISLDPQTLTLLVIVFFIIIAILAAVLTPKKKTTQNTSSSASSTTVVKKVKRKKIRTEGPSSKDLEEHRKHLERIEKRIDELHDKVETMHNGHSELIGQFKEHLTDKHGVEQEINVPPPLPPPPLPPKDCAINNQAEEPKNSSPGPHLEALHPEGPPENMSLGDEHGEIAKKAGADKLPTVRPSKNLKKCPKCGGDVEQDWVKCPSCSAKI